MTKVNAGTPRRFYSVFHYWYHFFSISDSCRAVEFYGVSTVHSALKVTFVLYVFCFTLIQSFVQFNDYLLHTTEWFNLRCDLARFIVADPTHPAVTKPDATYLEVQFVGKIRKSWRLRPPPPPLLSDLGCNVEYEGRKWPNVLTLHCRMNCLVPYLPTSTMNPAHRGVNFKLLLTSFAVQHLCII